MPPVLSKMHLPISLTYNDYYKNDVIMTSYRLTQLKDIARSHKLKISGTKAILIDRITTFFYKSMNAAKIQSIVRMYLIKLLVIYKGQALRNKKLCVNETDFYTLEPLENLNFFDFFSYKDNHNFIYGFDIDSILTLIKKPGQSKNPYNRLEFPFEATKCISFISKIQKNMNQEKKKASPIRTMREQTLLRMREIRRENIETRIDNLFYEIDNLGNYSSRDWISGLNINGNM